MAKVCLLGYDTSFAIKKYVMTRDSGIIDRAIQRHMEKAIRREENLRRSLMENEAIVRQSAAAVGRERYNSDEAYRSSQIDGATLWRKNNPERYLELVARWRDANRDRFRSIARESMRKRRAIEREKYGMSLHMYNKLNNN